VECDGKVRINSVPELVHKHIATLSLLLRHATVWPTWTARTTRATWTIRSIVLDYVRLVLSEILIVGEMIVNF
jgi:hypothetical protein